MNRWGRWWVAAGVVAGLIGCTGDLQQPPDVVVDDPPISEACDDSQWVSVPRLVGDSLVHDSEYVAGWVADSLAVRTILDLNNLTTVSYYEVTEVDTCGRVTMLNLSALLLSSYVSKTNYITYLPPLLSQLSELRSLWVFNNRLDSLPSNIGSLPLLHTLKAQRCGLDCLPESICDLDSLKVLYLFDNDLVRLPDSIGRLPSLEELKLTDNDLDSLPVSIVDLPALSPHALTVTGNHLCTVSETMAAWLDSMSYEGAGWRVTQAGCDSTVVDTMLVRDALDGAGLTTVGVGDVAIVGAGRIVAVDVSQRGLTEIPRELFSLTALEALDVSGNSILALPNGIDRWTRLRLLDISDNALTSDAVASMGGLDSLCVLDMSGNFLSAVPDGLGELDSMLTVLDLANNALDTLALIGWNAPASLEWLDLSGNSLGRLATSVGGLHALRELDVSRNVLDVLPPLDGLVALEIFRAADNALRGLPSLSALQTLRVFDLSSNTIDSLPPSIGDLACIDTLDLTSNRLEKLPLEITALDGIGRALVAGNRLCDVRETIDAWLILHAEPGWDTLQECPTPSNP